MIEMPAITSYALIEIDPLTQLTYKDLKLNDEENFEFSPQQIQKIVKNVKKASEDEIKLDDKEALNAFTNKMLRSPGPFRTSAWLIVTLNKDITKGKIKKTMNEMDINKITIFHIGRQNDEDAAADNYMVDCNNERRERLCIQSPQLKFREKIIEILKTIIVNNQIFWQGKGRFNIFNSEQLPKRIENYLKILNKEEANDIQIYDAFFQFVHQDKTSLRVANKGPLKELTDILQNATGPSELLTKLTAFHTKYFTLKPLNLSTTPHQSLDARDSKKEEEKKEVAKLRSATPFWKTEEKEVEEEPSKTFRLKTVDSTNGSQITLQKK